MKPLKHTQNDFTEDNLPQSRPQVFWDCIKMRYPTFLRLGLVLTLFSLPYLFVGIIKSIITANVIRADLTINEMSQLISQAQLYADIANVVCYLVMAVGFAGAVRIVRQLIWYEPLFFHQDFWEGVKINGGAFAVVFLLLGLINCLNTFIMQAMGDNLVKAIPIGITLVIFVPTFVMCCTMVSIYTSNVFVLLKNAFVLHFKTLPLTMLVSSTLFVPTIVRYVLQIIGINPSVLPELILTVVYFVAILPVAVMLAMLHCCSVLDKYVNQNNYPEIYKKGIWTPEK